MRTVKKIHISVQGHMGGTLPMRQPLPGAELEYLDPFLLLHHHGPAVFKPNNAGLPFGPHPHRGIETVTFILDGDVQHRDNSGHVSVIGPGGVQWMTAGRGLIHSEQSSDTFKAKGGNVEILQLWINLPARSKMSEPFYQGWQADEIPEIDLDEGKVHARLVAGDWGQYQAAYDSKQDVHLQLIRFDTGGRVSLNVPAEYTVFFYVINGCLIASDSEVKAGSLAEFDTDGNTIDIISPTEPSLLLFGYARPLEEPVFSHGPFVMNTEQEIVQAYDDYRQGKFGVWQEA